MNWDAIGAVGEVVGAAGVIATLIYLATQIRQNTNQLRGEAISTVNESEVTLLRDFRDDQDLARAYVVLSNDWSAGNAQQKLRVHAHMYAWVRNGETAFNLWLSGALPEKIYKTREDLIVGLVASSGMRVWWEDWNHAFDPDFVQRVTNRAESAEAKSFFTDDNFFHPKHWAD